MSEATRSRILVVEDEALAQRTIARVLKGYELEFCGSLASARDKLARNVFDLVLLDLILSDGHGRALLDDIERIDPQPRVVVRSAQLDADDLLELNERRVIVVYKGVEPDVTREVVAQALNGCGVERFSRLAARVAPRFGLTAAESRALVGMLRALDENELAEQLGCSAHTVHKHVQRVYDKSGYHSKAELLSAVLAMELRAD